MTTELNEIDSDFFMFAIADKLELLGDSAPLTIKEKIFATIKLKQGLFYDDIAMLIHDRRRGAWN